MEALRGQRFGSIMLLVALEEEAVGSLYRILSFAASFIQTESLIVRMYDHLSASCLNSSPKEHKG